MQESELQCRSAVKPETSGAPTRASPELEHPALAKRSRRTAMPANRKHATNSRGKETVRGCCEYR